MIEFQEKPGWFGREQERLSDGLSQAVIVPFQHLLESLGPHSTTGNDWTEEYPDEMFLVSSDPENHEYPQMQTGSLRDSVAFDSSGPLDFHVGFFGEDEVKLFYLEFGRMKVGDSGMKASPVDYGPLYMTFEGKDSDEVIMNMGNEIVSQLRSR